MSSVRRIYNWLGDSPHQMMGVRVLQVSIGIMLLFRVSTEWPFYRYLWGPSGVASGSLVFVAGPRVGHQLDALFSTSFSTALVLLVLVVGALGLVFGVATRASTFLALVTFFLLEQRLPQLPDGGDNVTRIVLIYMVFLLPRSQLSQRGTIGVWLHNVAILAIVAQICILYEVSGFMKAYGEKWHSGIAMYYVSNVEWFSLPVVRDMFKNPLVVTSASYVPMFYQLLFPMALLSRLKLPWLAVGLIFHIGVIFLMGLVSFSMAMIALELFLITDVEYASILGRVKQITEVMKRISAGFPKIAEVAK